jgi:hypothetical protein
LLPWNGVSAPIQHLDLERQVQLSPSRAVLAVASDFIDGGWSGLTGQGNVAPAALRQQGHCAEHGAVLDEATQGLRHETA